MPIFPDGSNPQNPDSQLFEMNQIAGPDPDPFAGAPLGNTINAAFRQDNPIVSVLNAITSQHPSQAYDPNWNPLSIIKGTKYEANDLQDFLGDANEAETRARMARIDQRDNDRQTLAASGAAGTVAQVSAGLLDPTLYLPIAGEAEAAREGTTVARSALRLGAMGTAQGAASEALLQGSQEGRSPAESAWNIASNTLMMGILGGAMGALSKPEIDKAAADLDAVRKDYSVPPPAPELSPEVAMTPPVGGGLAQDAGAASSDTRDLTPKNYGLNQIPGVKTVANKVSPNAAIYASSSVEAKRAAADLGETAIRFTQHDEGLPTSSGGAPLESLARVQQNVLMDKTQQILQNQWVDHYYGGAQPNAAKLAAAKEGIGAPTVGDGADARLSYADFKTAVYDAGTEGDVHPIPQVQQAAQELRQNLLDPVKNFAQSTLGPDGRPMLGEELEAPKGDVSFMPRQYVRNALIQKFHETREAITNWLQGEQTAKAAAKDRISDLQTRHEALGDQIGKLEGRLETVKARSATTGTKLDERAMEARSAVPRADALEGRAGDIRESISELEEFIGSMRGELRDPAAQQRLNDLQREISSMRQEAAPMSAAELARIEKEEVGSVLSGNTRKAAEIYLGKRAAPKEPSFTAWMAREGGIFDKGGNVRSMIGRNAVPGLIRNERDLFGRNGQITRSVDDWGERFAEMAPEAFPDGRPTESEVLDIIDAAHNGHPPYWFLEHQGAADTREVNDLVQQLHEVMTETGAEPKSLREIAEALNGLSGQDPRLLTRLLEKFDAAKQLPHAEETLATAKQGRGDLRDLVSRALTDRGKREAALSREGARASEATRAANRTKGRLGVLNDRLDRQQTMHDLLDAARQNAEDERQGIRAKMEAEIRNWKGKSTADAVSALKARDEAERVRGLKQDAGVYQGKGERLTAADGPVDRAVKHILASDRDLPRQELQSRAEEILNRMIGSPDGRIPYDAPSGGPRVGFTGGEQQVQGALNSRDFAMPTRLFPEGTINKDVEHVMSSHLRTMLPDIHLTARFGDVDMTDAFRRINEEYDRKITADTPPAKAAALFKERDQVITKLAAMRDRFRHVYGWSPDPGSRMLASVVRDFQNVAALNSLGTSVLNRMTDLVNATFRYGFQNVFKDAFIPLFKAMAGNPDLLKIVKQQARDAGVGMDGLLGHVSHNIHDVINTCAPGNKFSRGLAWTTNKSMLVNMHGPWTDYMKALVWNVAQGEFGRVAKRVAETGGTKADLQRMADANITPDMARRISEQYEAHHTLVQGSKFANTAEWTDHAARQAFEAAMTREANISVLTAGIGDKPLWLSKPLGSLIGQFHSFTAAAHEKILISNLQQRDARSLEGLLFSVGMGMLSYRMYTIASGQSVSDDPRDWIKEGIQRSALTGWLGEINQLASKTTSGAIDYNRLYGATAPLTRRAGNTPLSEFLGPSFARAQGIYGIGTHAFAGKLSATDIHQARMILPLQNLMGVRRLFDDVEDGAANAFGMTPRKRSGEQYAP